MVTAVRFVSNLDKLASYLCYVAKQISCGYYQERRFFILPYRVAKNPQTIFFPDLPYPKTFWEKLVKFQPHDYIFHPDKEIKQIAKELLQDFLSTTNSNFSEIEKQWRKKEKAFLNAAREFIPTFKWQALRNITVLISPFGTVGSFFFQKQEEGINLELTLRSDFGPAQIAETILTSFLHMDNTNAPLTEWIKNETIIDFLLTKTKLGQIFAFDYHPTISTFPELTSNLACESEQYLQKLGFPSKPLLEISNYEIALNGQPQPGLFTPTEKRILTGLIQNKNRLLTYEDIGNLFWGEEASLEKFSLYSIAKIMEKIRKKIKDCGVYQELIYTVRGQGYVAYD